MAAIWLPADVEALYRMAGLVETVNRGLAPAAVHSEIRQLEDRFGLSPLARRRLQWELDQVGGEKPVAPPSPVAADDRMLRAVPD